MATVDKKIWGESIMADEKFLYTYSIDSISLNQALQHSKEYLVDAIAFLYSPEECIFARFENSKLRKFNDKSQQEELISIKTYTDQYIFEARIFNENYELRWLNENIGIGRAALISEEANPELLELNWQKNPLLKYLDFFPQEYLLWGQKTDAEANKGWQKLSSARIGILTIPLEPEINKEQRVYLKTKEYLRQIDDNGNVAVIEERLVKLEVK